MNETTCPCERCGRLCRVGGPKRPGARLLRRAVAPKGYCADCAATQFLKSLALAETLAQTGPEALLAPHVQAQFAAMLRAGNADAAADEINWRRVVENWSLPVAKAKGGRL